ncbi:MAG TPA: LPS assembly lipoprotein LptE [Candidatus Bathyarchaeia archaeon]|nr:LPS assembly lipoprotein LptE [Candidatus Bathyarchaeia archaeon]
MNKRIILMGAVLMVFAMGCGYTTSSALPPNFKTVYVDRFENKINFTTAASSDRNVYFPLLEVKAHDAVVERFQFDGNLRIAEEDAADLILEASLIDYNRNPLRYTDNDDVEEYRVQIVVALKLIDAKTNETVWEYGRFIGEATYFITGAQASTEEAAVQDATVDLARRIVERTIENW